MFFLLLYIVSKRYYINVVQTMKQKQRIRKQSLVCNIFIFERNNITRYHHNSYIKFMK